MSDLSDLSELTDLHRADHAAAVQFFSSCDPVELVAQVTRTSDEELLTLIGREDIRSAAVPGILARLHEFAIPERLAGVSGVVRFDLLRRGRLLERHALRFSGGGISLVDPGTPPDVVLSTSVLRFVRLISGERNAGLEFLGGTLDIDGDADLALALGGIFRVPGSGDVAVDPSALDPVDVATVLKGVGRDHLDKVMSGSLRGVVLGEIFRRLPDFVDPGKASRTPVTVGFRLTGSRSGEIERYLVQLVDGTALVTEGDAGHRDRDATITCSGADFLRLATGHLSPVTGVLRGTLKVRGDKARALAFSGALAIPEPR